MIKKKFEKVKCYRKWGQLTYLRELTKRITISRENLLTDWRTLRRPKFECDLAVVYTMEENEFNGSLEVNLLTTGTSEAQSWRLLEAT